MEAIELPAVAWEWLFEMPRQSREMHHRLSSQMYRSSPGVKVSVSWNRIVDAMIEFAGGDFAKLASSMCMKLIAEYVRLRSTIFASGCAGFLYEFRFLRSLQPL